jgi:phage terminase large subunit
LSVSKTRIEIPQKLLPLFQPKRYKVIHGGRGSAKSWSVARALVSIGATKPIRVLCARETQKSIQESVHRLLKDQIESLGLDQFYTIQENKILGTNGTEFTFAGIRQQGVFNLKSYEGTDICWVEEAQVVTKKSWDVLIPTIRKPGSEIWVTFNPELDTDETFSRFVVRPPEESVIIEMNWQDNPWFPPELDKERRQWLDRDPIGYLTTWEGKCRPAVEGAIYANEIEATQREGRIRAVPYDPQLKVHTVWDLGWNDSMSIICVQRVTSEVRVIDYIEDSHRTVDSYVMQLQERKWNWGTDYIPHDGAHRDFKSGKSTQELLQTLGRNVQVLARGNPEEGIRLARMIFPRTYFDADRCTELVNHLKRYRRQINQVTQEAGAPLHDEHSHAADAFRYLAQSLDMMNNDNWGKPLPVNTRWVV